MRLFLELIITPLCIIIINGVSGYDYDNGDENSIKKVDLVVKMGYHHKQLLQLPRWHITASNMDNKNCLRICAQLYQNYASYKKSGCYCSMSIVSKEDIKQLNPGDDTKFLYSLVYPDESKLKVIFDTGAAGDSSTHRIIQLIGKRGPCPEVDLLEKFNVNTQVETTVKCRWTLDSLLMLRIGNIYTDDLWNLTQAKVQMVSNSSNSKTFVNKNGLVGNNGCIQLELKDSQTSTCRKNAELKERQNVYIQSNDNFRKTYLSKGDRTLLIGIFSNVSFPVKNVNVDYQTAPTGTPQFYYYDTLLIK